MKKGIITICMILFTLIYAVNLLLLSNQQIIHPLTGSGITASVSLTIVGEGNTIYIDSPLNQSYPFGIGANYTIWLNASSNFNASEWYYSLWDMRHNSLAADMVGFSPNITFDAGRWENKLIVYAVNGTGGLTSKEVEFYVDVPNSAPYFSPINYSMYVCEGTYLSYFFNVTDVDEQALQLSLVPLSNYLIPSIDHIYLDPIFTSASSQTTAIELFSGLMSKEDSTNGNLGWKTYSKRIQVTDGEYSDTAYTNITVIAINQAPVISTIGVQTVQTKGENSTFYKQVEVSDAEDGNQESSDINFNISFLNSAKLFNISSNGIMNFTPNENQTGVYNISVCVNDSGLENPYEDISVCGQDGGPITVCQNFSLTVTNQNRAPTITDYSPSTLAFASSGNQVHEFSITKYDPDWTIPDTRWYVDGALAEYDSGSSKDYFSYTLPCNFQGTKTIKAEITDGELNDFVSWVISVSLTQCSVSGGGGGGGGGGKPFCKEIWFCGDWNICQSASKSLETGLLSGEDYRIVQTECAASGLDESTCGVQSKNCFDTQFCNTTWLKPVEFQSCHYTENPNCNDGIKNCHDGGCELLVDCGGPCKVCPSCSDKIQNQGEEGVDCGGPCPWKCKEEEPFLKKVGPIHIYLLIILLIILLVIVIIKIKRILNYKEKIKSF